ncbi:MAG: hypothetical protein J6U54_18115 [Clostridiales bacterium]|nr:hypothetical protein [Clostridiales bacterium]
MKLTNLNCPQCSGLLNQERDMFFCSSCGSAFKVDYDEHDVKYAQLVTQASRSKMQLDKDIDLMQTESALRQASLDNAQLRHAERAEKQAKHIAKKTVLVFTIVFVVAAALVIGSTLSLKYAINKSRKAEQEAKANITKNLYEALSEDESFVDNLIAAGQNYVYMVTRDYSTEITYQCALPRGEVESAGEQPKIVAVYIGPDKFYETKAAVHLVYKVTYKHVESGEIIEVYQHVFTRVWFDEYNKPVSEYDVTFNSYSGLWPAGTFYEKDQLYRICIMPALRDQETYEISIPEGWEVAK